MSLDPSPPMTPPECDLRDFPFMPLDVVRLRDSDMAAHPDAEVFRAALLSWCVAWHQVPAASLPDDDAAIARLVGMGRDMKGWKKLRAAGALRGFVLCSDGRLYHDVVAEKAVKSWEAKQAQRDRTEKARLARLSQTKEKSVTDTEKHHEQSIVSITEASKGEVRESKGKGEKIDALARFEDFWAVCPKKTGKGEAERAWPKARKLADADAIINAMRAYAAAQTSKDKTFTKTPGPWLNGKHWLDDGIAPAEPIDPQVAAEAIDKADRYFKRGKYAEKYA